MYDLNSLNKGEIIEFQMSFGKLYGVIEVKTEDLIHVRSFSLDKTVHQWFMFYHETFKQIKNNYGVQQEDDFILTNPERFL